MLKCTTLEFADNYLETDFFGAGLALFDGLGSVGGGGRGIPSHTLTPS